jgi:tRNA nucleotidyltransferase (CCA-adding enzyme)
MQDSVPAALARASFPGPILEVLRRLDAAGHRSWIVGGAIRDLLLHRQREASDYDVATPATPAQVTALFRKVVPTGIEHGTVTVLLGDQAVEVTTFRGEGAYVDGRRPESVTFHTDLDADLARRDFTMNALAFDPLGLEFRDPFGGRADLGRRTVRAVGDPAARFAEDGLRAMRAVRFAAQLGYAVHPGTRRAIPGALDVVRKVSLERITDELVKLVVAPHADRGVVLLRATGLLGAILPPLAALPAPSLRHAARMLPALPSDAAVRLAALVHGVVRGAAPDVGALLGALRLPRRTVDTTATLVRAHVCFQEGRPAVLPRSEADVRRWLSGLGPDHAQALLALATADAAALPAAEARDARADVQILSKTAEDVLRARAPLTTQELALDGRAVMQILGAGPGPHVGEALRHLLDRVLADPAENIPERLADALRQWWAARSARL